jgi:O-antigen/teichoic acid export membrane protein
VRLLKPISLRISEFFADTVKLVTSKEGLKQLWHVSLYSNAFYLTMASVASAVLGFIFWVIATRFYSTEAVGLASAAIAAIGLLGAFAYLGLGTGLIRFLPNSGKTANSMVSSVLTISTLTSVISASIFLAGLSLWSPALLFLRQNAVYFIAFVLFTIAHIASYTVDQVFVAKRRAGFFFTRNVIFGLLKLLLVILLAAFFHSFGIFASWGISLGVSFLVGTFLFLPRAQPGYRPFFVIDRKAVNNMLQFSFANYISGFFWGAPVYILPIMVVNQLGAEANAFFYIAWAVAGVLTIIPSAISTSLFVEGSHEEESLQLNVWRSLKVSCLTLVPAVILILAIAPQLLLLFSRSYSENASTLLRILAISSLPLAINAVYLAIMRVEKKLKIIVGLSAFAGAVTLGLTYLLLPLMGINGAGIAWLAAQSIIALVVITSLLKRKRTVGAGAEPLSKSEGE